jgi:multidrug efflux pump subunit AcrA (membrane-fusion protein)
MNKTLLLIIVDFLFLNLIALTRWEKAEPIQQRPPPVLEMTGKNGGQPSRDQDLVDVMRLSLADEQKTRERTAEQLQAAHAEIQSKEQSLSQLQAAKGQLESSLTATQQNVKELGEQVAAAAKETDMTKERLAQIQRQLEEKQAEAERQKKQLAALAQQQKDAQQRIENLSVTAKVAEQEKDQMKASLDESRQKFDAERAEWQKVIAQQAEGVGQLAKKSGEIAQEIRSNQPINANTLFSDFLSNRVEVSLSAYRRVLIGSGDHVRETQTVLVTDGKAIYALLHANETPFPVTVSDQPPVDWERITGQIGRPPAMAPIAEFQFLALDPRLIVIPVDAALAARIGVKIYKTAALPFKFPEAVLVSRGGAGYGEVPFQLDPKTPQYVRMDNRFIKHLIGDFTPTAGDLVFSKTGDLIGIMVNSDYCAIVDSFLHTGTIKTGEDTVGQHTSIIFSERNARWLRLPSRLQ